MNREIVFQRLYAMRKRIEADTEKPLLEGQNSLLYDVAKELGLTERQAQILAGDIAPDQPTQKINLQAGAGIWGQ